MLDEKAFANATAAVAAGWYLLCVVIVLVSPNLLFDLFGFISHGVNIEPLRRAELANLTLQSTVLGLALWTAAAWVTFYAGAALYNQFKR